MKREDLAQDIVVFTPTTYPCKSTGAPPVLPLGMFTGRVLIFLFLASAAVAVWQALNVLLLLFDAVLMAIELRAAARSGARLTRGREGLALAGVLVLGLALLAAAGWDFGSVVAGQVDQVRAAVPAGCQVALTQNPGAAVSVVLMYAGVQFVGGNVITPLVQAEATWLPPMLAILSSVAFSVRCGPVGVLLGAPLTLLLMVAVDLLYVAEARRQGPQMDTSVAPGEATARPNRSGSLRPPEQYLKNRIEQCAPFIEKTIWSNVSAGCAPLCWAPMTASSRQRA